MNQRPGRTFAVGKCLQFVFLASPLLAGQALRYHPPTNVPTPERGAYSVQRPASSNSGSESALTCSPAPCRLPNVQASEGGLPANTNPIAVNPNNANQLLVGAFDYNCGAPYVGQGFFSTSDAGTNWTHTCLPTLSGYVGEGDPILGYDLNNVVYAGGLQAPPFDANAGSRVVLSSSVDNGVTWGAPVTVIGAQLGYSADFPWLEIDDGPDSPHKNALYVSSSQIDRSFSHTQIWTSHSIDGGKHWASRAVDPLQTIPTLDLFSDVSLGSDGTAYITWLRCSLTGTLGDCAGVGAMIMFSKSLDGGSSWTTPVEVAAITLAPDPMLCCYYGELPNTGVPVTNVPSNAVLGSGPTARISVAFYNWTGTQMQVEVATSSDGGISFAAPVRISPSNSGDQFFQWISASSGGKLAVTWLDRRNDPSNVKYQPYVAISANGGISFGLNRALSNKLSDPANDGFGGQFLGYYRTHVWAGRKLYAAWMDTRTGSAQAEVGGVQF